MFTTPIGALISFLGISYHQFADDTQLYTVISSTSSCMENLSACADAVMAWYIRNDLLLNSIKTEVLAVGKRQQLAKFDTSRGVTVSGTIIPFVQKIRVLGADIDSELSLNDRITSVVRSCNYQIHALWHIMNLIDRDTANRIAGSIVCSRLDYYNAILYGVTEFNISRLQWVQKSLARTVCTAQYRSSCAGLRRFLHWLPVKERITYKVAAMTFKADFATNRFTLPISHQIRTVKGAALHR